MEGARGELVPARARLHVDLDDARIGRDLEIDQARIGRRLVALDDHGLTERGRARLDRRDQLEIILEAPGRRHEDVQYPLTSLGTHRGSDRCRGRRHCGLHCARSGRDTDRGAATCREAGRGRRGAGCRGSRDGGVRAASVSFSTGLIGRRLRQRLEGLVRIRGVHVRKIGGPHPGQRIERQAKAHRRVAGGQMATLAAQQPGPALPGGTLGGLGERQHISDGRIERAIENAPQPFALAGVGQRRGP